MWNTQCKGIEAHSTAVGWDMSWRSIERKHQKTAQAYTPRPLTIVAKGAKKKHYNLERGSNPQSLAYLSLRKPVLLPLSYRGVWDVHREQRTLLVYDSSAGLCPEPQQQEPASRAEKKLPLRAFSSSDPRLIKASQYRTLSNTITHDAAPPLTNTWRPVSGSLPAYTSLPHIL